MSSVSALVVALCTHYKLWEPTVPTKPPTPAPVPVILPVTKPPMPTAQENLYTLAKSLIGTHLTLDESVPQMVGCAEAVSKLLQQFGTHGMPLKGIQGTAELLVFLQKSTTFKPSDVYAPGNIIICPTERGADGSITSKVRGHVGVCGKNSIMSNNSYTGLWGTDWDIDRWTAYYHVYGGIPIHYFGPV